MSCCHTGFLCHTGLSCGDLVATQACPVLLHTGVCLVATQASCATQACPVLLHTGVCLVATQACPVLLHTGVCLVATQASSRGNWKTLKAGTGNENGNENGKDRRFHKELRPRA